MQLAIDGRLCEFEEGQSVLDVAQSHGIDIPALCSHPQFEAYGGCRLCCVEALSDAAGVPYDAPKLVAACMTKADSIGAVRTRSERIDASRRITLTLLGKSLGDVGALADLVAEYGVHPDLCSANAVVSEAAACASTGTAKTAQPASSGCILCGLCVRACDRIGRHALFMVGIGSNRHVEKPAYRGQSPCNDCKLCHRVCPTGAAIRLQLKETVSAN